MSNRFGDNTYEYGNGCLRSSELNAQTILPLFSLFVMDTNQKIILNKLM